MRCRTYKEITLSLIFSNAEAVVKACADKLSEAAEFFFIIMEIKCFCRGRKNDNGNKQRNETNCMKLELNRFHTG